MQGDGVSRDSLLAVFCLTVCQQLQIVDKNNLRIHPLSLCHYPSTTPARCRADEQRQLVQFSEAVKVRLRNALIFYICQRNGQTVRNDAGGQGIRVGFKAEIAHTEAPPGLLTGHLQGQGGFTGGRSAADDEQVTRGKMQVLVQHRDAAGNVLRLFIQFADVGVYQFSDWHEILFFPVKGQGFAHPRIQVGQVCKGGQAACCLNGQFLKSCQSGLFQNKPRPFFHAVTGQTDTLTLALLHAFQNSGFLLRVAGTGCHCIQFALCVPKTRQSRKHRLKGCREVRDFQIRQRVGGMSGLYLFDKQTGELSQHPLAKKHKKLENVFIYTLFRDCIGRICIGTEESLFLYAGGKLEELHLSSSAYLHGLIQAFCVQEDSRHEIWIGSSAGLYCYKEGAPTAWKHYTMKDGLPNDFIYNILEDERGRLWLTTNKGLACFNTEEGTFLNYSKQDGLPHDQFNYFGACKAHDGTFYLGSLGGVAYFKPYELGDNPYSPDAVVTGAVVLNQVITDMKSERVRYYQDEQGRMLGMSFPSDQKLFNIRFAVINYLAGKRNQFVYNLEGCETEWNYSRHVSFARSSYSNHPPGEYVFKVKACNNNGKWSEATTEFFVHIIPMWYQTWWAKTLFIFFSVGLLVFVIFFFIARAKMKMQVRIEQIERNKIEEISQEKVRFYMNMSHELRTPLSLILAPLEELLGQSNLKGTPVQQKLDYVYKNGRKLLHIVNQLLDFRNAEAGAMPIHVAQVDVEELLQDAFALFKENAQKRAISFHIKSDLEGRLFPADRTYVETILMNLLSNAFKITPDGGSISLSLWTEGDTYGFTVRDSGIGMSPEQLTRIFERFYLVDGQRMGTGIGLSLVKMLVEKHHGTITVASEPAQYTEFKVTLPADMAAFTEKECELPAHEVETSASLRELPVADEYFSGDASAKVAEEQSDGDQIEASSEEERPTILLVDDNKEMVDYLKDNFRQNYVTLTAGNGEEALAIMKEHRVDIVLSDVMMPGIDGIKLCQLIKRNLQTCHIPVLLLSAKGSVDAQTEGIQAGADDYIAKPFSIHLLKGKIANQLKARQRLKHYYSNTSDIDTAKMTSNNLDEEFMSKAIQVVEENISNEDFTSDELASQLCMSRSSLYLKMNSISGEPPANFIRRIRFNKACKLLLEGRYSISEISGMAGFGSSSYFSTSFKKYVGCLPSEYVKQHTK